MTCDCVSKKFYDCGRSADEHEIDRLESLVAYVLSDANGTYATEGERHLAAEVKRLRGFFNPGAPDGRHLGQACMKGHDLTGCGCGGCLHKAEHEIDRLNGVVKALTAALEYVVRTLAGSCDERPCGCDICNVLNALASVAPQTKETL